MSIYTMNTINKSFLWGIIFASITWVISLYLYMQLAASTNSGFAISTQFSLPGKIEQVIIKKNKINNDLNLIISNNIGNSYDKQIHIGAKDDPETKHQEDKKSYVNSDKLIKSLQAVTPTTPANTSKDLNELGMLKNLEDKEYRDEGYKLYAFNALVSKKLDPERPIPDTRHKLCRRENYPSDLQMTSVVICFYNEHFETLIRTVTSVLRRTSPELLQQIILVDDNSDIEGLSERVSDWVSKTRNDVIKYLNNGLRQGLIRARMLGASFARAEVIVFLDSHIEVNDVWLEPLLSQIAANPKSAAIPIIDIINPDTFAYTPSPLVRGGFNWGLHFKWENLPTGSLEKEEDFIAPIKTPAMAGGLFAMNRLYFTNLGEYDPGMDIWGGENLELSFRIWMCGGELAIIPCSRIGHVFRKRRPYGAPNGEDTMLKNSLRVAYIWLDEYKEYFFKQRPESKNVSFGSVKSRLSLREQLKCKDFSWYLKNVYPELVLPSDDEARLKKKWSALEQNKFEPWHSRKRNYVAQYQIRLSNSSLCIQSAKDEKTKGASLILANCLRTKKQMWYETDKSELVLSQLLCLDAGQSSVRLSKCHEMGGTQEWKHKGQNGIGTPIYNMASGTCLGVKKKQIGTIVSMEFCTEPDLSQWDLVM